MQKVHFRLNRRLENLRKTGFWTSESGIHSRRVAEKLAACSSNLGISRKELLEAGLLHDVGKSLLDPAILYKARRPTPEEKAHIDEHSFLGFEILEGASPLVREAALRHHDVEGADLWLQVLHLIDIEDACGNDRCYRKAMPEELLRNVMAAESAKVDKEAAIVFWAHWSEFRKLDS